jgi:predicted MFS family arabinose efflux permease
MAPALTDTRKWTILAILAMAGGIIYELPYMRYTFYKPLQEGLGFDHTHFGSLMSIYGVIAMIFYLPGGWLADRLSHRKLLAFSLVGTGLGGYYLSSWPSYTGCLVLFGWWGITSILTFWAAMLKAISMLGDETEQGRLFSFAEGGRGVVTSVVAFGTLAMFRAMGEMTANFKYVLWTYATVCVLVGIACYLVVPDNKPEGKTSANVLKDVLLVVKMPIIWVLSLVIFAVYTTYTSSSYMTPYMTEVFGLSAVTAGVVATLRSNFFRPVSGGVAGSISKKLGSSIKVMMGVIVIVIAALVFLLLVPVSGSMMVPVAAVTIFVGFLLYMLRGLYFAPVGEVGTPVRLLGAAMGLISTIAFASDIFNFAFIGSILDNHKGPQGYHYIFIYMICLMVAAFLGLIALARIIRKHHSA